MPVKLQCPCESLEVDPAALGGFEAELPRGARNGLWALVLNTVKRTTL
jgi:hypothetical protein